MLALVTPHLDEDLVRALGGLRRQGVTVSVVHVLAGPDAAQPWARTALDAAGVGYCPIAPGDDLRTALAARTTERAAVAR